MKNPLSPRTSLNPFQRKIIRLTSSVGVAAVTLICTQASVLAQDALTNEQLTQLAEPAIVRVFDGCAGTYRYYEPNGSGGIASSSIERPVDYVSLGTGFIVHSDGYIATNAHVVNNTHEKDEEGDYKTCKEELFNAFVRELENSSGLDRGEYLNNSGTVTFIRNNSKLIDFKGINTVSLPDGTEKNFSVKTFGDPIDKDTPVKGKDVAIIKIEVQKAPTLSLSNSELPKAASEVLVMGYPSDADFSFSDFESVLQMSTLPANVSSIKKTEDGVSVIQINTPISPGNSGGPVINKAGEVVGLISFGKGDQYGTIIIPSAIPTSTLKEFVGGVVDLDGQDREVDKLYREGLDQFWTKDYRRAKLTFERVKGLFEEHSEVDELIKEANIAISDESIISAARASSEKSPLFWIIPAAVLGLGGLIAGGIFFGKRSSSKTTSAFVSEPPQPSPKPPYSPPPSNLYAPSQANNSSATRVHALPRRVSSSESTDGSANNGSVSASNAWLELEYKGEIKRLYLAKDQHKLGRDDSWADLAIPNEWGVISGRHATLQKESEKYRIFDGDGQGRPSSNGLETKTGDKVDAQTGYLLEHGAQLTVGSISGDKVMITFFNPTSVKRAYDPTQVAR